MRRLIERFRLVIVVAVGGLAATTVMTLLWGVAKAAWLGWLLVRGGWRQDTTLIALLEVIDLFLVATVQVIVVVGLYELFVDDLDLPDWLTIHDLGELKRLVVEVLMVVLGIKFLERALASSALDTLYYGVATALVIGALVGFAALSERARPARGGVVDDNGRARKP